MATNSLNTTVALFFGFLSFLSPCILPLLPGYLSFIAGTDLSNGIRPDKKQTLLNSLFFVLGFGLIFIVFGAAAGSLGQYLTYHRPWLTKLAGLIIIIFGLHTGNIFTINILFRQFKCQAPKLSGRLGAFLLGVCFALGWTPCVGPVLASILLLASGSDPARGMLLLTAYTLGLGFPFILAAMCIGSVHKWLQKTQWLLPYINAVSGALLITMGILLLTGTWQKLVLLFY
ncbi:cytochrome c biogenesis protein transmembrane region [Desulfofarcimen acetoxidans DSM 771]|uniref:Cytochrome c biogenesis protein transmembrane region n=1 Tax=Desulfofarcimen acetoxidans (strain ATCC 49208 / DSM 771 / KCTC 5769 / VKM B-1644 / 5575) TaxID=485916 RepID=C8VVW4_DESAS|nr:cytochrome c biogenesis protein transmembrane region [Desulfofarcimen acetoxidans DSM 771]